jgi:hypothetical protein
MAAGTACVRMLTRRRRPPTRRRIGAATVVLAAGSCLLGAIGSIVPAARAAAPPAVPLASPAGLSWTLRHAVNPPVPQGSLVADSCAGASFCAAVGYYDSTQVNQDAFIEEWNGVAWKLESAPSFAGQLLGVSCTSAKACMAVGFSGSSAVAERFNGASWKLESTPKISGSSSASLTAVSCSMTEACTAVGFYDNVSSVTVALAESWNGTTWKVENTPDPPGFLGDNLDGVSCMAPKICTAVGSFVDSSGVTVTLADVWNGTSWKMQSTPNPSAGDGLLSAVSCTVSACTAVGYSVNVFDVTVTLAEMRSGATWKINTTPNRSAAVSSTLAGVVCTSANACAAVGTEADASGNHVTLAEAWNGATWKLQTAAGPAGSSFAVLTGVSCGSQTACAAVGYSVATSSGSSGVSLALAEERTGTSWKIERAPDPSGIANSSLIGLACTSAHACIAVGDYYNAVGTEVTLAEVWNGATWKVLPTPNISGASQSFLSGVSCAAAKACIAVGGEENRKRMEVTLAEVWNGATWKVLPTPNPAGAQFSSLAAVSCTAPTACTAVGEDDTSQFAGATLAEAWNGTTWKEQSTPHPAGSSLSSFKGVSCKSTTCTAVGSSTNKAGDETTLAEAKVGGTWRLETSANPKGAFSVSLAAVSCSSAKTCTAVGDEQPSPSVPTILTLAEVWNGASWKVATLPSPGKQGGSLIAVTCVSRNACTAVGQVSISFGSHTLAEAWNGSAWKVQTTPNPAGTFNASLFGVSCTSAADCTAVGDYTTSSAGNSMSLAETEP